MMRYSDRIFVKGYGFLSFAKNMGKNTGKNISKYSSGMLAMHQKLLDQAKKSTTDALKTSSKTVFQKTAETTVDLVGNKIANKITKLSRNSKQNTVKTV